MIIHFWDGPIPVCMQVVLMGTQCVIKEEEEEEEKEEDEEEEEEERL